MKNSFKAYDEAAFRVYRPTGDQNLPTALNQNSFNPPVLCVLCETFRIIILLTSCYKIWLDFNWIWSHRDDISDLRSDHRAQDPKLIFPLLAL